MNDEHNLPDVRGQSLPWPLSTRPTGGNAEGFHGRQSSLPARAEVFHSLLAARISGWLSGELDPPAARAVGRLVDRDAEARRLAGGYHRVDAVVRDWYEAMPTEPVERVVVPQRIAVPTRWRQMAVAAGLLFLVVSASRIDTAQAVERLFDAAAERIDADDEQRALAPTAYWRLRAESFRQLPGPRSAVRRPNADPAAG